jgi:hypothetical protein
MIGVTIFGLFLTPVFDVLLRSGVKVMIRKGGYRFSLATSAKRLRGDHAPTKESGRDIAQQLR